MAEIIEFPKIPHPANNKRIKKAATPKQTEQKPDTFEKKEEPKKVKRSYTIEQMTELIGLEKAGEIFSRLSEIPCDGDIYISPPDEKTPLLEGLRQIWDNSYEAEYSRAKRVKQLTVLSETFREYEKACSEEHKNRTGENIDIKIKIKKDGKEMILTDILDRQAAFYKKSKVSASLELMGKRFDYKLDRLFDTPQSK